jgi:FkbM family methyltransferase
LEYFGDFVGNFLDIGSFTGIELSNVRNLALKGWKGIMVEPSPTVFPVLQDNYKDLPNIHCLNVAVGEVNGESIFYDNPNGVATLVGTETRRWNGREKFNKVRVPVVTFNQLYHKYPFNFHFISIDCEGLDNQILKQIDLDLVGCMMIIIEWNSKTNLKTEMVNYINKFDLKLVAQNPENLIFTK